MTREGYSLDCDVCGKGRGHMIGRRTLEGRVVRWAARMDSVAVPRELRERLFSAGDALPPEFWRTNVVVGVPRTDWTTWMVHRLSERNARKMESEALRV